MEGFSPRSGLRTIPGAMRSPPQGRISPPVLPASRIPPPHMPHFSAAVPIGGYFFPPADRAADAGIRLGRRQRADRHSF